MVGSAHPTDDRRARISLSLLAFLLVLVFATQATHASPTPEEISRSFTESMQQEPDYWRMLPWFFAFAGSVLVVMFIRQRQVRQAMPRVLNHPGKLVREMVRNADIDAAEMKKLKAEAKELDCEHALTLLLCPSLRDKPPEEMKLD
jgi:hypothetical protein